jgi:hypothetical protein
MNREDRKMTREEAQQVLDLLAPGFKLPPPRTEEEFLAATRPINFELEEEMTKIHGETIMNLYKLYKKEKALKNDMA